MLDPSSKEGYTIDYFISNPYQDPITVLCDIPEFNKLKVLPQQTIRIPLFIPEGLKPWTRDTTVKGRRVTWVGLLDINAPDI
jgi:hypothetical protein